MKNSKEKPSFRREIIATFIVALFLFMLVFNNDGDKDVDVRYSEFVAMVEQGKITSVEIDGERISFQEKDAPPTAPRMVSIRPAGEDMVNDLVEKGISVDVKSQQGSAIMGLLISLLPIILLIAAYFWIMRKMSGGPANLMSIGKSKARLLTEQEGKVTFADVAGVDEAREELKEIVDFLKSPEKFSQLGGKIPRGALLIGPPGTGKTLLARAVAGEAGVPFYIISGSDFVEMFVGVGAKRVRDMFEQAKKNAPCIVFIDEIDAVGRSRGMGVGGGNDEREQTLNQLLVEMDGFSDNQGVIIIAATNRKDVLDPALLRPGRFDRQIFVSNPDLKGREKILAVHASKMPLADDVSLSVIARGTPGFSGADLKNLLNEAALLAARRNKSVISEVEVDEAKDKVMLGAERREMFLTPEQKKRTAYHEAGHAIVGLTLPKCDPVYKATIIPRGGALGMVVSLPEFDRLNMQKDEAEQKIAMTMAGKAAEMIIYGEQSVSNGPSGDIQQATALARAMVMRWGMSEKVGPVDYTEAHESYAGGTPGLSVSPETRLLIESEVKRIINEGYEMAKKILNEHEQAFHNIAKALLSKETLSGAELGEAMRQPA